MLAELYLGKGGRGGLVCTQGLSEANCLLIYSLDSSDCPTQLYQIQTSSVFSEVTKIKTLQRMHPTKDKLEQEKQHQ